MKRLIKKILKEDRQEQYLNRIIEVMKNDFPLYKNLKLYGFTDQLSEEEMNYIFSGIFGEPVRKNFMFVRGVRIYNKNGDMLYLENSDGYWVKYEYDDNGNIIYFENSDGYWEKKEYDENGNIIYRENSKGKIIDNR